MKWVLVVYFFILGPDGGWFTAEELGRQSWYRTTHNTAQECIVRQHEFTANNPMIGHIRASCEPE